MVDDKGGNAIEITHSHIQEALDHFEKVEQGGHLAYTFGWGTEIDDKILGLEPGNFVVVGGENKHGKTTHAINTTYHNIRRGHSVLYVTMEISPKWIVYRLVARKLGLSLKSLKVRGALTPEQRVRVKEELINLDKSRLTVLNGSTLEVIEQAVEKYQPELVIVDHFQRMDPETDNLAQGYKHVAQGLKQLAVEQEIPVMVLSQVLFKDGWVDLNKAGEFEYTIQLMGTRWTNELHGEADKVLYLHNVGRQYPAFRGRGHVIYHSIRDYEAEGFSVLKLDYGKMFVGDEKMYQEEFGSKTNTPY